MDGYEKTYCVCNILLSECAFVPVDILNGVCLSKVNKMGWACGAYGWGKGSV
jgi:hypothetical protein